LCTSFDFKYDIKMLVICEKGRVWR